MDLPDFSKDKQFIQLRKDMGIPSKYKPQQRKESRVIRIDKKQYERVKRVGKFGETFTEVMERILDKIEE